MQATKKKCNKSGEQRRQATEREIEKSTQNRKVCEDLCNREGRMRLSEGRNAGNEVVAEGEGGDGDGEGREEKRETTVVNSNANQNW